MKNNLKTKRLIYAIVGFALVGIVYIYLNNYVLQSGDSSYTVRQNFSKYPNRDLSNNVSTADFVGSNACAGCHQSIYKKWTSSTHGNAGGDIELAKVIGDFDGIPRKYKDAVVTPFRKDGGYYFRLETEFLPTQEYKVSAVVGGGFMTGGGTQTYFTEFSDGTIRFLPFDFHKESGQWFGETGGKEGWLPISEDREIDKILEVFPTRALGFHSDKRNCQECHGSQIEVKYQANAGTNTQYKSLTINCESCHGAGREHISKVSLPDWKGKPDIGMVALETLTKDESLNVCFRCHALKDPLNTGFLPGKDLEDHYALKYPIHGGTPYLNDGRVKDFGYQQNHLASDCYINGSMTCVDCHDPHSQTYRNVNFQQISNRFDDNQCTSCHVSKSLNPIQHTFHEENSPGSKCVACHMPYLQHKGTGNTLRFARSDHTIPIPRPEYDASIEIENACVQCHTDKTINELQLITEKWYGKIKPHNRLVTALDDVHPAMDRKIAAEKLLNPSTGNKIAQMAAISRFTNLFLVPDSDLDPEIIEDIKAFTFSIDYDVKSLALASLHLANDQNIETHNFLVDQLDNMDSTDAGKIRDRWAHAMPFYSMKYENQGDYQNAIDINLKALEIKPDNIPILLNVARLHEGTGRRTEAITYYTKVLQIDPNNVLGWLNLGNTMMAQGDFVKAVSFYKKTIELDPWNYFAYFNLGKYYFQSGDYKLSIDSYKKALEIYPSLAYVYIHLASTYIKTKELDKALQAVKTGLWLDPNDPQAKQILNQLGQL